MHKFDGNLAGLVGLWGVRKETLDGYVRLAESGASVDDLQAYCKRHELNIDRHNSAMTVASVKANRK